MPARLVNSNKRGGVLHSITLLLEDKTDIEIFDKLIASVNPCCPKCENILKPQPDLVRYIEVDTPLTDSILDFDVALAKCPVCEGMINLGLTDYASFPSVLGFVTSLRRRYSQQVKAKGGK